MPPPRLPVLLPEKVLLLTVALPSKLKMPPPFQRVLLPAKVLLLTFSTPCWFAIAPPTGKQPGHDGVVLFPEKVLWLMFTVPPSLKRPPPRLQPLLHRPLAIVRFCSVTVLLV